MTYLDLQQQFPKCAFKVYVFTGPEKGLMNLYLKSLNYLRVESFSHLVSLLRSGLFIKGRVFVLENSKEVLKHSFNDIVKMVKDNTLILIYDSIDKRMKFFKDAALYTVHFDWLEPEKLVSLVQEQLPVSEEVALQIIHRCGQNVDKILQECHKLKFLDQVTVDDVVELVTPVLEYQVFDLMNAVLQRDRDKVFYYYDLMKDQDPAGILSLLYGSFRRAFLVKSYASLPNEQIAAKTGLSKGQVYMIKKYNINGFTVQQLLDCLDKLFELDLQVKRGRLVPSLALQDFLLEVFENGGEDKAG